jgi:hypothetical protein
LGATATRWCEFWLCVALISTAYGFSENFHQ